MTYVPDFVCVVPGDVDPEFSRKVARAAIESVD